MSNQVFANAQRKYYPCPGIDEYNTDANLVINGSSASAILFRSPAVFLQSPGYANVSLGVIGINVDGIYTITAQVALAVVIGGTTPIGALRNVDVALNMNSGMFDANGTKISRDGRRLTWAANITDEYHTIPVSYTGYLRGGSTLSVSVNNLETAPADTITVRQDQTYLRICKII